MTKDNIKLIARSLAAIVCGIFSIIGIFHAVPNVDVNVLSGTFVTAITLFVTFYNVYKNWSYTPEAKTADLIMAEMKAARTIFGGENNEDNDEISHEINDPADDIFESDENDEIEGVDFSDIEVEEVI